MVMGELAQETGLLVIGGGPGGYAAAFRAADLGLDVTLVEIAERPGGVCLFRGCIPSKTYLYLSELIFDARRAGSMGLTFSEPKIDLEGIRNWKASVVNKLSSGLLTLTQQRGVQLLRGRATFDGPDTVRLHDAEISRIKFKHAIIATGSHPIAFPGVPRKKESRVISSTEALDLPDVPEKLLVIGGGYVGLELGSVYASLGSRVTLIEHGKHLLPGVDKDLVRVLKKRIDTIFTAIELESEILSLDEQAHQVAVTYKKGGEEHTETFDRVLTAIGRKPNTSGLGLETADVKMNENGFIIIDEQQRTSNPHIFAVGDVVGGAMLAHKASREGKVAAEVIAGQPSAFDVRAMPAVVYTDPQIAWCGITETEAKEQGRAVEIKRFPWKISGRAATMGLDDGLTKMIIDAETRRILGVGIVGRATEGLIAEAVLAIEMGALVDDMALSIHPHPTLSETESEVAEIFLGSATHILSPAKKK
ncbi:MAG: dihydrolipoyl dehydrogenase [Desulfobacteraceae bacterium]|nr:dihydrolipoyl dehydrogenase [Desulfobacteraceae bacterium]